MAAPPATQASLAGTIATGLDAPWGLAFLPDGSALVTERDSARVKRISAATAGGPAAVTVVGTVAGVRPGGEGGLLGIAVPPGPAPSSVLVYYTADDGNRVDRIAWNGSSLGAQQRVLGGIPRGTIHNGGRIAFGPDGLVYVATGETGSATLAQDRDSLAGKVLRITADGKPAPGNPFPGSPVFTLGHRNVQGLAFDPQGRLFASEFGNRDVDELNLLAAGGNYGWPVVEGPGGAGRFTDPVAHWSPTAVASPSGTVILRGSAWVASLRGQRLWQVRLDGGRAVGDPVAWFDGQLGRLRDVVAAPDGSLWVLTNNTDGRGSPRAGDDRIVRIVLS